MVEKIEPEVIKILAHINKKHHFLLSGGAGSGKTYSLVRVIRETLINYPKKSIACITYTNAAVKEIQDRISHPLLLVSTIHDFLWDTIKQFQKELKIILLELINSPESKIPKPNKADDEPYTNDFAEGISYKEYLRIDQGEISHNEVLLVSNHMYAKYKRLSDILKSKYSFIYVDEYQDTNPQIIELLLDHTAASTKQFTLGFFGDAMQAIFDDGVGDLNKYLLADKIKEVQKTQNRRNPQSIIHLANKIRLDELVQEPSNDSMAPNMIDGSIVPGEVRFVYTLSNEAASVEAVRNSIYCQGWDWTTPGKTKELNLTHNLIANMAGFKNLMDIYDKDPVISLKNDLIKKLKNDASIQITEEMTFEEVVDMVSLVNREKESKKALILANLEHCSLFNKLKDHPFSEVRKIYLDKDSLIDDKKDAPEERSKKGSKRDAIIRQLFKIQELIDIYDSKNYNEFIKKTSFKLVTSKDKTKIKQMMTDLSNLDGATIEKVIDFADTNRLCRKDDHFNDFVIKNWYLYERVGKVEYCSFQKLYNYLEGYTPFSTQHKVKGTEYENVLVVLDNGGWTKYNFAAMFGEGKSAETVIIRTKKLFYVCCTRAMNKLTVYYHNPSQAIIESAKLMFGDENVYQLNAYETE